MPILIRTGIVPEPLKDSLRKARRKQVVDKQVFDDLAFRSKLKAFTVAGDLHNSQIEDIMTAANNAIQRGVPFRKFKASLDSKTFKRITSPEVVFRNAGQSAYQQSRFNQQEKLKNIRPFGEYVTFGDDRVRPNHAILNGRVAALNDAFWAANYPPNGHQCRCVRRTFSQRQIDNKGVKVKSFQEIKRDAFNEQARRGIAPGKRIAPLADPGWRNTFRIGDTGTERMVETFKNFKPAAFRSLVSPKPVQITPPKIKPIADTTNHAELSLAIEKELGIKNSTFSTLSLESSKAFSKSLVGLTKKFDQRDFVGVGAARLKKNVRAVVTKFRLKTPEAVMEFDLGSTKNLDRLSNNLFNDIKSGWIPKINTNRVLDYLPTHEYAHTLFSAAHFRSAKKAGLAERLYKERFQKAALFERELSKLHRQWRKELRGLQGDLIAGKITPDVFRTRRSDLIVSSYAQTNVEEFFAESFAEFELSSKPGKFSKLVGELTRRVYGK